MDIFDQVLDSLQKAIDPVQVGTPPPAPPVVPEVLTPPVVPEVRMVKTADGLAPLTLPDEHDDDFTDGAAPPPKIYRDTSGRFKKGNDGGPGRPPSFAWLVREITGDGVELAAFAVGILRGDVKNTIAGISRMTGEPWVEQVECSAALKFEAARWLKEQGFGKEVARLDVTSNGETLANGAPAYPPEECPDLSKLTTDEVRTYLTLRKKALAVPMVVDAKPSAPAVTEAEIVP